MNTHCPLPVDWLDYVDGSRDPQMDAHLDSCPSCAVLVRSLSEEPAAVPPAGWAERFRGRTSASWRFEPADEPVFGELWLSRPQRTQLAYPADTRDGIPLLIVSDPFDETGIRWVRVVPVRSDVEDATPTDYLLNGEETTVGCPWRLVFSHEGPVPNAWLAGRVGCMTSEGRERVLKALSAQGDPRRWGSPAGVAAGTRSDDRFWNLAVQQLRSPWLQHLSDPDMRPAALHDRAQELESPSADTPLGANVHWLRPETPSARLAFAADSTGAGAEPVWKLEAPVRIEGRLRLEWSTGRLLFHVDSSGCPQPVCRVRLFATTADQAQQWWSEPFELSDGADIPLAEEVFPHVISELGAEVLE